MRCPWFLILLVCAAFAADLNVCVKNGVNELPVEGATVEVLREGTVVSTGLSGIDCTIAFNDLADGSYTVKVTSDSYYDSEREVALVGTSSLSVFLSSRLGSSEMRAILSWGKLPSDLDSHLHICGRCHVYFANRVCHADETEITLDVDVVTGEGPETITLDSLTPGRYSYYVYRYSSDGQLSSSQGQLDFYAGSSSGVFRSFKTPSECGRYWRVFDLVVTDSAVTMEIIDTVEENINNVCLPTGVKETVSLPGAAVPCGGEPTHGGLPTPETCLCDENVLPSGVNSWGLTEMGEYASAFSSLLRQLDSNCLGADAMVAALDSVDFNPGTADAVEIVQTFAESMRLKLDDKVAVLEGIQTALAGADATGDLPGVCCAVDDAAMEPWERFKSQRVDATRTCSRYPDTLEGSSRTEAENDARVGSALLNTWKENLGTSPGLAWQYLGTESGGFTKFPTSLADTCGNYDPRFRPWYVNAASSEPKDVVVILDKSGSMLEANRISIAREAAVTVLDTLNPNDYVSVIAFNDEVSVPGETFQNVYHQCHTQYLVSAAPANKIVLDQWIDDQVCPFGGTVYSSAFARALQLLDDTRAAGLGTNGSGVILFLSDGAPTDDQNAIRDVLAAHRNATAAKGEKPTHVFTYALGDELDAGSKDFLRTLAEENDGAFTAVDDNGDLRSAMASYYGFFSSNNTADVQFSAPYLDSSGLGLVVTASLAVEREGRFFGVLGTDLALDELTEDLNYFGEGGQLSYAFLIDNKGRTYVHPNLPAPLEWQSEPTFVDISTLEQFPEFAAMHAAMLAGEEGSQSVVRPFFLSTGSAGIREVEAAMTYAWKPIPGTPFIVGLALSSAEATADQVTYVPRPAGTANYYHRIDLIPSAGPFCMANGVVVEFEHSTYKVAPSGFHVPSRYVVEVETVSAARQVVNDVDRGTSNMIKPEIANDIWVTAPLDAFWRGARGGPFGMELIWSYVGTMRGVFRTFPGHTSRAGYDPRVRPWFLLALSHPLQLAFTTPYQDSSGAGIVITAVKSVAKPGTETPEAVLGVDLSLSVFERLLDQAFDGGCTGVRCFVLDTNGFLVYHPYFRAVSATSVDLSSVFIGAREPFLAEHLVSEGYLTPSVCSQAGDRAARLTYSLDVPAVGLEGALGPTGRWSFVLRPVSQTNLFVVKVAGGLSLGCSCDDSCACASSQGSNLCLYCNDTAEERGTSCMCPCECPVEYDPCRNKLLNTTILDITSEGTATCPVSAQPIAGDSTPVVDGLFGNCIPAATLCARQTTAAQCSTHSEECFFLTGCPSSADRCVPHGYVCPDDDVDDDADATASAAALILPLPVAIAAVVVGAAVLA